MQPRAVDSGREDIMAEINITPFTDVLLVLLIIFMLLAALAIPPGFQKSMDGGPAGAVDAKDRRPIQVMILDNGHVFVDGKAATDLEAAMRAAVAAHTRDPIHETPHIALFASDAVPYQRIVDVLDAGRSAGDDDVGFEVESRSDGSGPR